MIITLRQAAYIATMAVFGAQGALGSAAHTAASTAYASPPKVNKHLTEPDFGFTTSKQTRQAFDALKKENEQLWMRDFQATLLYRNLRAEINKLQEIIDDIKRSSTQEKSSEIEKKETEIKDLKQKNQNLEAHMKEHFILQGEHKQLQKNYEALIASIDAKTNRTTRSNANFAALLADKGKFNAVKKKEAADFSDDDE